MKSYVLSLDELDSTMLAIAGSKAANLGELAGIQGINVPPGFCISTTAFKRVIEKVPALSLLLEELSLLTLEDRGRIAKLSSKIREFIQKLPIPDDIAAEVSHHLEKCGEMEAYAVRSSATAEDLPTASFAGQQDTYLNIIGKESIFKHITECWASLFTDRAILYRLQQGYDHCQVYLAVVVQKMVFPQVAGIVFTADPSTCNRKVLSIDASFGLGEAMVSGLVSADNYKVNNFEIIDKRISVKKLAIHPSETGGTYEQTIEPHHQKNQALTNEQIIQLARIGRQIEAHFGLPQDIEWCLVDDAFYIVQSRPITALYPTPAVSDEAYHVYVSVGHQQMMTDAMKPLGLSFFQLTTHAPMQTAGGRLFVDVTSQLASPTSRTMTIEALGESDPLIKDALLNIVARDEFICPEPAAAQMQTTASADQATSSLEAKPQVKMNPLIVQELMNKSQASLEQLKRDIELKSGAELFDFIQEDIKKLQSAMFGTQSMSVIMAALEASAEINERIYTWLGEKNAADTLSQSVPNNVTSEMGLALLDVADVIRPYPLVIEYLHNVQNDDFLKGLVELEGGQTALDAIHHYLDLYGMRCVGEIDISKVRWNEKPATLASMILSNIKNFEAGASIQKFMQGRQEALEKERDLLLRLRGLADGEEKARKAKRMIDVIRNFSGYREYPKYKMMSHYFVYKTALLKEAEKLVQAKILHDKDEIYYLTLNELRDVVCTKELDYRLIEKRKEEFRLHEKLSPPRVITSDGEIVVGRYRREDLPAGAIAALAVSSGTVEGRARVILNMEDANIEKGDILVTAFTDPGWTALFVSVSGLVTEVGGLMTHGAVIAREYGLPAVVGVENATKLIKDGQRIRVNGTDGYVELL